MRNLEISQCSPGGMRQNTIWAFHNNLTIQPISKPSMIEYVG